MTNSTLKAQFNDYAADCRSALRLAMARIVNMKEYFEREHGRSPFASVDDRLKTFESVLEKCGRRNYPKTIDSIRKNVRDVAGIRIITTFRDDIYVVTDMLEHIPGLAVTETKDYVKRPKANGYQSLHLNVQVEVYSSSGTRLIPVEIQIRDKAMDTWAAIEHVVSYKNPNQSPEVRKQFKQIADLLTKFDKQAITLRDSIEVEKTDDATVAN